MTARRRTGRPKAGLSRRSLLLATGGVAAGVAATAAWPLRNIPGFVTEHLASKIAAYRFPHLGYKEAILAHFHYLDIDETGVEQFADEYEAVFGAKSWSRPLDHLFETFLMSSDFFTTGANERRKVHYLALYAPDVSVCHNPLARFD